MLFHVFLLDLLKLTRPDHGQDRACQSYLPFGIAEIVCGPRDHEVLLKIRPGDQYKLTDLFLKAHIIQKFSESVIVHKSTSVIP